MEKVGHQYSGDGAQALTCVPFSLLSSSLEPALTHALLVGSIRELTAQASYNDAFRFLQSL